MPLQRGCSDRGAARAEPSRRGLQPSEQGPDASAKVLDLLAEAGDFTRTNPDPGAKRPPFFPREDQELRLGNLRAAATIRSAT